MEDKMNIYLYASHYFTLMQTKINYVIYAYKLQLCLYD